jgi:hypothetical protein
MITATVPAKASIVVVAKLIIFGMSSKLIFPLRRLPELTPPRIQAFSSANTRSERTGARVARIV